jgi:hypothetical protein
MMRRRPVARTVGRTALIAGTATAVSGRVAARQGAQAAQAQAAQPQTQPPAAQPPTSAAAPQPPAPAPVANPAAPTSVEQLTALAALREQGVLTDAEFESEKAKILSG